MNDIQELYLIIVFCTASALIFWIYRTVSLPLAKLQAAARNIKEGNLDFEIKNETNDEIGQLCQDFEEMRLRLKANAEEKVAYDKENKELISNISHDLKTPITAIKVMWKELWMELQTLRRRWTDISRPSTIRRMKWIF